MSARGIDFLDQWIANNVPRTMKADVLLVDELTHKLIADAKALGIKRPKSMKRSTVFTARSSMLSSIPCLIFPSDPARFAAVDACDFRSAGLEHM